LIVEFTHPPIVNDAVKDALRKTVSVLRIEKIPFKKGDRVEIIGNNVGEVEEVYVVQSAYASVRVLIDGKPVTMSVPVAYLKPAEPNPERN
jgi:hypothetical protein